MSSWGSPSNNGAANWNSNNNNNNNQGNWNNNNNNNRGTGSSWAGSNNNNRGGGGGWGGGASWGGTTNNNNNNSSFERQLIVQQLQQATNKVVSLQTQLNSATAEAKSLQDRLTAFDNNNNNSQQQRPSSSAPAFAASTNNSTGWNNSNNNTQRPDSAWNRPTQAGGGAASSWGAASGSWGPPPFGSAAASTAKSTDDEPSVPLRTKDCPIMKVPFIQRILRFAIAKTKTSWNAVVPLSPLEQMQKIIPFCGVCTVWTETVAHYRILSDILRERPDIVRRLLIKSRTLLLPLTLDHAIIFGWSDLAKSQTTLNITYLEDKISPKTLEEIVAEKATTFKVVKICLGDNVSDSQFAAFVAALPNLEELCILHTGYSRAKSQETLLKTAATPHLKTIRQVHVYDAPKMIDMAQKCGIHCISSALGYSGHNESRDIGAVLEGRARNIPNRLRSLYGVMKREARELFTK